MPRTVLPKTASPGRYPAAGVAAVFTASDPTNGNQFVLTGQELIVAWNTGAAPYTITINTVNDDKGRKGDITAENINAGQIKIYGPLATAGWQQSDGNLYLTTSNVLVQFAIITLP